MRERLKEICEGTGSRVLFGEKLSGHSTISIGGNALAWVVPSNLEALRQVRLLLKEAGASWIVMGNGSNVLLPDEGLKAVVINLSSGYFAREEFKGKSVLAGAGLNLNMFISDCCREGLSGLEGLVGIPASVGGALATNASYRSSISDRLEKVRVLDENLQPKWIKRDDIRFGYRSSSFSEQETIVEAVFSLVGADPKDLCEKLKAGFAEKMGSQPLDKKTLGCVFKNPANIEYKSGQLIDMAGMKGARRGDAQVSEKHANFIVNLGSATSRDVRALIDDVRDKVREKFNIELETEIEIIDL
ncbi:MAG: UDP-N-acetylmuramate dehydrogenase [Candidatus Omnitrophota bacterium]|jgi:UDP-N-acetylmuramate dehydrogenase